MNKIQIAIVAHAAMAHLSAFAGTKDVVSAYADLPEAQKDGLLAGIDMLLDNPEAGPSARHDAWLEQMTTDGWKHGKSKDEEAKTHPRLVAFDQLPKREQALEELLHTMVRNLAAIEQIVPVPVAVAPAAMVNAVLIRYIGKKDEHTDNKYGTKLTWAPGQTHSVPEIAAVKMLKHTDTYEKVEGEATAAALPEEKAQKNLPVPLPHLEGMSKSDLANFAQQHYGENLPDSMTADVMRDTILSFIQARGR